MSINIDETNIIGYPGVILGDLSLADPSGDYLTSFYGNDDEFGFDLVFSKEPTETKTFTVTDVTCDTITDNDFLTVTKIANNTLRFAKSKSPFEQESYDYRLTTSTDVETYSIEDLPNRPATIGIVKWRYPNDPKYIFVTHRFTVNSVDNLNLEYTDAVSIGQYYYWRLIPSLNRFTSLVQEEYE